MDSVMLIILALVQTTHVGRFVSSPMKISFLRSGDR